MKDTIMIYDDDRFYAKKFCNQANKLYGKKYVFISFADIGKLKNYVSDNKVESFIMPDSIEANIDDVNVNSFYILNEKEKMLKREGKKNYVYKLQNVKNILQIVDEDISKKREGKLATDETLSKLIIFYTPSFIRNKTEVVKKITKSLIKKKKVLIVELDEFSNFKGAVGLSNIILSYKRKVLSEEILRKEIYIDKDLEIVNSVTYPDDFQEVNNIDIANIVNEIRTLKYDYVFVIADNSYIKSQYIMNDADKLIILKTKNDVLEEKLINYMKNDNSYDIKKITEFSVDKIDKAYINAFIKENFLNEIV